MIVVVFLIILIAASGGVAAWYFLVYKPGLGPAPAPAYVAPPVTYTVPPPSSPPPPSTPPSPSTDDDYDPLELGEVVSPAGSPSAAFSIALWRIQMKKKYSKKVDVLKKRLEVLEDAKDDDKEMSGTVPSEYFEDAIKYLKDLIKNAPKAPAPKAPAPKAPFVLTKWKTNAEKFFEKKTIDDVRKSIEELKAAKKAGMAMKNDIPKARYDDAIDWLETIMKRKERAFDLAKWKVATKNAYKEKSPSYIQQGIDRLEKAMKEKIGSADGVPRSKYAEAITWLKFLKKESEEKFDFEKWKADSKKKLEGKTKTKIQEAIDKAKTEVPKENRTEAVRFLERLKTGAKK
jgi:hypothetical protein